MGIQQGAENELGTILESVNTTYVIIPDGPLDVLRPYYVQRIEEAYRTIAAVVAQAGEEEVVKFADAGRIECFPTTMLMLKTASKVVIKSHPQSPVHVTVAAYDAKLDLHISDENKKKLGEQWWSTLGTLTPGCAEDRVAAARAAASKFEHEHTAVVRILDPSAVGFIMNPLRHLFGDSEVPLVRSGRRAVPAVAEFARRMRSELVRSFPYAHFPAYQGSYFYAVEDGVFFSEPGRIRFLLSDTQQPEGMLFLANRDFTTLAEVFLKTLFGLDPENHSRLFFPGF